MFSTLLVLFFLAGTTLGFSQSSISPTKVRESLVASGGNSNVVLQANLTRRKVFGVAFSGMMTNLLSSSPSSANADTSVTPTEKSCNSAIAYRTIKLPVPDFGVDVPVSVWYPITGERAGDSLLSDVKYNYKISLRRIGQLLAKWDFIPEIISKEFSLTPSGASTIRVVDGTNIPISDDDTGSKVVFLAHGFLGSRSDLGYIAEDLASQGYVCVAAEYPESLEASYPRLEGLDRVTINKYLVPSVKDMIPRTITSYSAIGHSLGCGTVLQMGDESWNRVLMGSGRAPLSPSATNRASMDGTSVYKNPVVGGRLLFISSVNDGPVNNWGGGIQIPDGYTVLQESKIREDGVSSLASIDRAALVFGGETAPNHISYLSENVNDSMLSFLSPLLPVTGVFGIPVLDFDKYADSRDSVETGKVLKPLISGFLGNGKC